MPPQMGALGAYAIAVNDRPGTDRWMPVRLLRRLPKLQKAEANETHKGPSDHVFPRVSRGGRAWAKPRKLCIGPVWLSALLRDSKP